MSKLNVFKLISQKTIFTISYLTTFVVENQVKSETITSSFGFKPNVAEDK